MDKNKEITIWSVWIGWDGAWCDKTIMPAYLAVKLKHNKFRSKEQAEIVVRKINKILNPTNHV